MTFRVRLVNRAVGPSLGNNPYPVQGISGNSYGTAFLNPEFGGPVFDMSLEEYDRVKYDLIGNQNPIARAVWVPTFYKAPDSRPGKLKAFNELQKRAKAAGVWQKGMKKAELEKALTTV